MQHDDMHGAGIIMDASMHRNPMSHSRRAVLAPALPDGPQSRRNWLEEKARNRLLEDQMKTTAVYEVEVKTGKMKVRAGPGVGGCTRGAM